MNYFLPLGDLDFAWQVRTGERIIRTGVLRQPDSFTYTIAGKELPDYEWLYEVAVAAVWNVAGWGGLKLLKTALVVTPLVLLARWLRREGVRWHGVALAELVAVAVVLPTWNLRPLVCSTIGLLLVAGWLHEHCRGRRPVGWRLPVTMLLWANLHPGVIAGQGLLAGAVAGEWLNRRLRWSPPLSRQSCGRLTLFAGLGLAATFLAPDPFGRLLYPFRAEVADPVQTIFAEIQPGYTGILAPPYTTGLAYALAALVGLTVLLRFRHYRNWELCLLAGTGLLAQRAFRCLPDWTLVMLALGVPQLVALLAAAARNGRRRAAAAALLRLDGRVKRVLISPAFRWQPAWPALALAALAVASLPPWGRAMPAHEQAVWPTAAVDWVEAHGLPGAEPQRVFGPPDYGAYLIWRLDGRVRVFTDTRGFYFDAELIGDSHYLPLAEPGWRDRLNRVLARGTDYFLLEADGPRGQLWRELQPRVGAPLYLDGRAVLLSREQVEKATGGVSDE
jgi:hypothetical protein